jgi:hypothetical protein
MEPQTVVVRDLSNRRISRTLRATRSRGLVRRRHQGGYRHPRRAPRHLHEAGRWSDWSHVFIFEGVRADGQHWVVESDIHIQHKNIQLGARENRAQNITTKKCFPRWGAGFRVE